MTSRKKKQRQNCLNSLIKLFIYNNNKTKKEKENYVYMSRFMNGRLLLFYYFDLKSGYLVKLFSC